MPPGYYDKILKDGLQKSRGIQANWHNITFTKIQKLIHPNDKHLDCLALALYWPLFI